MSDIIIAARGGLAAKSRLADVLDAPNRAALTAAMLEAMLWSLRAWSDAPRVCVVTPCAELAELGPRYGAHITLQHANDGLNAAFDQARAEIAAERGDSLIALLPGDLPLLAPGELQQLFDLAAAHDVALAPASSDGGTGAIVLRAGTDFPSLFGPNSFARHEAAAKARNLSRAALGLASLGLDIDRPPDLIALAARMHVLPQFLQRRFAQIIRTARQRSRVAS